MISTSTKWKTYSRDIGTFHIKAVINNGTSMTLTDADFMESSVSITDSVSGMGDFTLGAVITNSFSATLNNFDGKFNNYQLAGAIISVQFGIIYEDNTEEWIDRGIYTIEKPTSLGSTIQITAYDDMDKLNKYYVGKYSVNGSVVSVTFPIDASTFVERLCDYCGVQFGSWELETANISAFEFNESTTCRQVISWVVESFGGYAHINTDGELEVKAFNKHEWTSGVSLDGGTINPWSSVSAYSGGTIQPWSAVTDRNGGNIGGAEFSLSKVKSLNVYIDDITITGIRAFTYNTVDEFDFYKAGTDGYVLAIQGNPLVTADNKTTIANRVNTAVGGLSFRPFDASIFGDPSIQAGDVVALVDYLGETHVSLITSLTYSLNQAERIECDAVTPEELAKEYVNNNTAILAAAATYANEEIANLQSELETQIDAKLETWVRNSDPSSAWTVADRPKHNGDLWYYTGTSNITVNGVTIEPSKTYQYNASTHKWVSYNNPSTTLFDFADEKTTIYYGSTSGTYANVETGDYLVDSSTGSTYRWTGSAWSKVTDYQTAVDTLDNSLTQQNVFNRLTNNGALQGLFMENGNIYMNGTYIKAGTIDADRIGAGSFTVTGGSVNIETNSSTADVISLQYGTDIATMRGGHFEIRKSNSDTVRGELGVSSDSYAAVKIYNASGKCVSNQGESAYGGGLQCNDSNENVRCVLAPSSLGSGALMLYNTSDARTVAIDAYSPAMQLYNSNGSAYTIALNGANGAIFAASYNNTSLLDLKKNVKKAESMLSKIVDADVVSFNYKTESKGAKSHIGLAIGGEYNVPEEVIAESDDGEQSGVDLYTMISMAWKAIQEQQEKIEQLEKRVAELESKKEIR